jgi:hypothetical protein
VRHIEDKRQGVDAPAAAVVEVSGDF